jgi:hypothetical protein
MSHLDMVLEILNLNYLQWHRPNCLSNNGLVGRVSVLHYLQDRSTLHRKGWAQMSQRDNNSEQDKLFGQNPLDSNNLAYITPAQWQDSRIDILHHMLNNRFH